MLPLLQWWWLTTLTNLTVVFSLAVITTSILHQIVLRSSSPNPRGNAKRGQLEGAQPSHQAQEEPSPCANHAVLVHPVLVLIVVEAIATVVNANTVKLGGLAKVDQRVDEGCPKELGWGGGGQTRG